MLGELTFSLDNILKHQGFGVAITGMSIVFISLALITLAISAMPRILSALHGVLPAEREHHATPPPKSVDDEAVAVAIGFALHHHIK